MMNDIMPAKEPSYCSFSLQYAKNILADAFYTSPPINAALVLLTTIQGVKSHYPHQKTQTISIINNNVNVIVDTVTPHHQYWQRLGRLFGD
jgi:hypothetical protein